MTVQRPDAAFFTSDCKDYIISSSTSITFAIYQLSNGNQILEEKYSPDVNQEIVIRDLQTTLESCLHGTFTYGFQPYNIDEFEFKINGTSDLTATAILSHTRTIGKNATNAILSRGTTAVCSKGQRMTKSILGNASCKAYDIDGVLLDTLTNFAANNDGSISTMDMNPDVLFNSNSDLHHVIIKGADYEYTILRDVRSYPEAMEVRFLNTFEVWEDLLIKGGVSVKPSSTDTVSRYHGSDTRFHIEQTDEYTANSGALTVRDEYQQWRDLMMSRKAEIKYGGEYIPILIKKENYSHSLREDEYSAVEFTFTAADPRDNGIITL